LNQIFVSLRGSKDRDSTVIRIITFGLFADFEETVTIIEQSSRGVASNKWRTPLGLGYNCVTDIYFLILLVFPPTPQSEYRFTGPCIGFVLHKNVNSYIAAFSLHIII